MTGEGGRGGGGFKSSLIGMKIVYNIGILSPGAVMGLPVVLRPFGDSSTN